MDLDWMSFLTVIVFVFALVMVLAGIFTAYFGSGRSRTIGVVLFVVGLIVGLLWAYLVGYSNIAIFSDVHAWDVVYDAFVYIIAALIGALVAVGIFLVAVMKS
ncbi:MAG: hypothetical protein WC248_00005 [Candidatus Methanomethylophilaceae archaeon]|jgi:hypothetical protein